jgi:uncharacterized protein YndB with AHSA1/START domain
MSTITVSTTIKAPLARVWEALTSPADIKEWCHASDDWGVGDVEVDLREGGRFKTHMMAKDGSVGFDFTGTYTSVDPMKSYAYLMDGEDKRTCNVSLEEVEGGVRVSETFDMENENSEELQRNGWQAILENLKQHIESK